MQFAILVTATEMPDVSKLFPTQRNGKYGHFIRKYLWIIFLIK